MSKRKYIIVALLAFVLALFFSELIFSALRRVVLPDHITPVVLRPAGSILSFFRFSLPFGLACAAIPISFMIVQNYFRTAVIVVLSIAGAAITLLVLRHQLRAGLAFSAHLGINPMITVESLDLEIVPWVCFGIMVLETVVLKMKMHQILKRNQIVLAIIGFLVVCLGAQTVQQIHMLRWEWEVRSRFEKAFDIQVKIEQLKASGAAPDKIATQSEALRATMTDYGKSFDLYLVPRWLQICANFGAFVSVVTLIVLWKKKPKQRDTGDTPVPAACSSKAEVGPFCSPITTTPAIPGFRLTSTTPSSILLTPPARSLRLMPRTKRQAPTASSGATVRERRKSLSSPSRRTRSRPVLTPRRARPAGPGFPR